MFQTKEVYENDMDLLHRNTTVHVARKPLPRGEKKIWRVNRSTEFSTDVFINTMLLMFRDPVTSSKSDLGGQVTADSEEGRLEEVLAASGAEYGKDNYKRVRGRRMPRPLAGEKLQVFL